MITLPWMGGSTLTSFLNRYELSSSYLARLGHSVFWPNVTDESLMTFDNINWTSVQNNIPSGSGWIGIDIEANPWTITVNSTSDIANAQTTNEWFIQILHFCRNINPNAKYLIYYLSPSRNYLITSRYKDGGSQVSESNKNNFINWRDSNIAAYTDFFNDPNAPDALAPSIYNFFSTSTVEDIYYYTLYTLQTARMISPKPIIPFLWTRLHPNGGLNNPSTDYIPIANWNIQVETVYNYAQGVSFFLSNGVTITDTDFRMFDNWFGFLGSGYNGILPISWAYKIAALLEHPNGKWADYHCDYRKWVQMKNYLYANKLIPNIQEPSYLSYSNDLNSARTRCSSSSSV